MTSATLTSTQPPSVPRRKRSRSPHAKLGHLAAGTPPAEWSGSGSPPGYAPVGGTNYLHGKTVGRKTAFISKFRFPSGAFLYGASGSVPDGGLPHQSYTSPQAAHAAGEAYLSSGPKPASASPAPAPSLLGAGGSSPEPKAPAVHSLDPNDPFPDALPGLGHGAALSAATAPSAAPPGPAAGSQHVTLNGVKVPLSGVQAQPQDVAPLLKGLSAHPDVKKKLEAMAGAGMTHGHLAATIAMASAVKNSMGGSKILASHLTGVLPNYGDLTKFKANNPDAAKELEDHAIGAASAGGIPPAAIAGPIAANTTQAANAPAASSANASHFVTLGGAKHVYKNGPVTEADVDKVAAKAPPGFSISATAKVKALVASGKIKDLDQLHQITAMGAAATSHAHISSSAVDTAMGHGGISALKDKAEAGDVDAQKLADALGQSSHLSAQDQAAKFFAGQSAADLMHQKDGGQAGSNPGGFYTTKNGVKVYAKTYADPQQAHSEHAANAIYRALGLSAPLSAVAQGQGGKTVYASKLIAHQGTLGSKPLTPQVAQDALRGHAADILTANHDVTGLGLDNLVHGADGKVARIDQGGALTYRAQGQKKSVGELNKLGAWDGFSDPAKNPDYAKLFQAAGYKSSADVPGLAGQIGAIQQLQEKHGGWDGFLQAHAPGMDLATREATAKALTKRTALLGQKRQEILDTQGGSLEALAGKTSVSGGTSRYSKDWGNSPFHQYAQKIDSMTHPEATSHFKNLYTGHTPVYSGLTDPISKWTGSSSGHAWQDQWPAALDGKTHAGAKAVAEVLQTRRKRWEALSAQHGVPFPETFHAFRGTGDNTGTVVPHMIAAWRNEQEPYMHTATHPAASWSLSKKAAEGFYGSHNGAFFETHIPFEKTLADKYVDDQSFLHSFGSDHEVVAGGQKDNIIVPKSKTKVKYKGTEYTYDQRQSLFDAYKKDHGNLPDAKHFGIDIAAHQKKVQLEEQVQLRDNALARPERRIMANPTQPEEPQRPDYDSMTPAEYIAHINQKVKDFQAPLLAAGTTPAPADGMVERMGSFAQARAELAKEKGSGKA